MSSQVPSVNNQKHESMASIFHTIQRLSPRLRMFFLSSFAISLALIVFGVCLLTFDESGGSSSKLSNFGTDTTSSLNENGGSLQESDIPTNYPSLLRERTMHPESLSESSFVPTKLSSTYPTSVPGKHPTQTNPPSSEPLYPSLTPSSVPTPNPSVDPSFVLSIDPSRTPSFSPTFQPTFLPTAPPSKIPTNEPTHIQSVKPTKNTGRPSASHYPTTTNMPTAELEFQTHDEPENPNSSFFNYNISADAQYGPSVWENVNSTANYWQEFGFVENRCNVAPQSPIDVCTNPIRQCKEHHEFRSKVNFFLGDDDHS